MRTYLAKPLAAVLLGAMLLAGGCVSEEKYKLSLQAVRNAQSHIKELEGTMRDLRTRNQELTTELAGRDTILAARDRALADLTAAHARLRGEYDDLSAKYQAELARGSAPTPLGPLLPAALNQALSDFAAANPDLVEYLPKYGMVKLKSDLTFAPGSVDIKTATGDALRKFVAIINTPTAQRFHIYIAGHTDDIPIRKAATLQAHPDNWYLSAHRAVAVQNVLARAGLAAARIGMLGFGEYHPIAPNAPGNKGNEANRRVEIWIVPPGRFLTGAGG